VGRRGRGHHLGPAMGPGVRPRARHLRPVVRRRAPQCLRQRARPPCRGRAGRADGADLGQPDGRPRRAVQLRRALRPHRPRRRRARSPRRVCGRPGGDLHADGAGGGDRHARLRPARCRAFRGIRGFRRGRTGQADRGCRPTRHPLRLLRAGAGAGGRLQADAGCRDRDVGAQAGGLPDPPAPAGRRHAHPRPRSRLRGGRGRRHAARPGAGRGDRPALCALHLRHHRQAQRHRTRRRRLRRGAAHIHAHDLRPRRRRRVLDRLRRGLGGRAQLHRLRPAARRLHHRSVRGQAGRHAGCGRVLACLRRSRREGTVHRADGAARNQAAGSGGGAARPPRPVAVRGAVPRRRALRPADRGLGGGAAAPASGRSLVASACSRPSQAPAGGPRPATISRCSTTPARC
jgi:hypothetical protein